MIGFFLAIWNAIKAAADWWWNKLTLKGKIASIAIVAVLITIGYIVYLQTRVENLQEDLQDEKLGRRLDEVNAITNQITNSLEQSNVLKQNTNLADAERVNSNNRDSSTVDGSAAWQRYCKRNPNDSRCRSVP